LLSRISALTVILGFLSAFANGLVIYIGVTKQNKGPLLFLNNAGLTVKSVINNVLKLAKKVQRKSNHFRYE
jgi:hypothetical protein